LKNHIEISEEFDFLDYEKAIKLSGSRFSVIKSQLALLSRALMNFMLDINTNDFGYKECIVPELVKSNCLVGTGQLPKFGDDLFKTYFNDLWLIPTAEVPLTNFHREEVINSDLLPLRYTSFTNCFRAEAGAAGKDTKGLMREHQFGKVELVSITKPDSSTNELERMIECVETILKKIKIPYRLVELCSGDLGFSSSYTIDFEVWMPGQNKFREVSSCSNCKDFQSRRMKMRSKKQDTGEVFYPHTLNGSSLAIGRILIGILENFQEKDGSISIPECLRKYMNNRKIINNNE
jgi:seryl-tRNA synthetase